MAAIEQVAPLPNKKPQPWSAQNQRVMALETLVSSPTTFTPKRRESSCLAAESLPKLAELVLVHLALALLLHAVRPHLRRLSAALLHGGGIPDRI